MGERQPHPPLHNWISGNLMTFNNRIQNSEMNDFPQNFQAWEITQNNSLGTTSQNLRNER